MYRKILHIIFFILQRNRHETCGYGFIPKSCGYFLYSSNIWLGSFQTHLFMFSFQSHAVIFCIPVTRGCYHYNWIFGYVFIPKSCGYVFILKSRGFILIPVTCGCFHSKVMWVFLVLFQSHVIFLFQCHVVVFIPKSF